MAVLEHCNPKRVFYYFGELTKIPHGSGDTQKASDYFEAFAKEHDLTCIRDKAGNVILKKPGSAGYENAPTVIMQGHFDMVCEKTPGSNHDFSKDPLQLYIEDGWVRAKDTTLGADDGISVAYTLAILEDDTIPHPPLEVVLTTDEEIGMLGASALDMSVLEGRLMINLDSGDENSLLAGCAGGIRVESRIPVTYGEMQGYGCRIVLDGLKGGHSGEDINKQRGNAALLLARFLYELRGKMEYGLCDFLSGGKDNVIPRRAEAYILIDEQMKENMTAFAAAFEGTITREYRGTDEDMKLTVEFDGGRTLPALQPSSLTKVMFYLLQTPAGVQKMSGLMEKVTEASLSPGVVELNDQALVVHTCVRSSVASEKYAMVDKVTFLTEFLGGECICTGDYPGWEYAPDSSLLHLMQETYRDMFGKEVNIIVVHGGLECGIFADQLSGLQCVAVGLDSRDIHTTGEGMRIQSVETIWNYLLEVLKRIR